MCNCYNCNTYNHSSAQYCSGCRSPLLLQSRYRIIQEIGGGGRGKVYLANQISLGRNVAIKQILGEILIDPAERAEAIAQFYNEAKILANLSHPNLPAVFEYFEDSINFYLAMEYVEGRTLEQILNNSTGFLSEKEVKGWATQICNVLEYLHSQIPPIVFRDIKPTNIMLNNQGAIKLIDFGIARKINPSTSRDTVKMGTVGYAPPEQFKGQSEPRSDIYALGATLYYLMTKHDPQDEPFLFSNTLVKSINPHVSDSFASVIHKAIQSEPANRFNSAREMNSALLTTMINPPPNLLLPPKIFPIGYKRSATGTYVNILGWDASGPKNVSYWIVRKSHAKPISPNDGEYRATVIGTSYEDEEPEAGVTVFYAIYTYQNGNYSKDSSIAEAPIRLADVRNIIAIPMGHGRMQLKWQNPPNVGQICVRRSLDGPVVTTLSDEFVLSSKDPVQEALDNNMPMKRKVYYTVFCRYKDRQSGSWSWSAGNTISVMT